jgi:hypothetical protein
LEGAMKTSFFKSIFILAFLCGNIFAQGEAALPFLTLPLAPQNIGLGGAGTSMLNDNASAFLMNPAMIGYQAKENNIGINIYPSKTNMGSFPGINIFSGALNIGYKLEKHIGFPIGLGFGYSHGKINYNYYFD